MQNKCLPVLIAFFLILAYRYPISCLFQPRTSCKTHVT